MLQTARNYQQENDNWKDWYPKRGEIFLVDLGQDSVDSEQRGLRPFVLVSNNIGNAAGTILVGCSISTKKKALTMIHVKIGVEEGLKQESFIMTEHIRSVSKRRFFINGTQPVKVGELSPRKMKEVEAAILFELAIK